SACRCHQQPHSATKPPRPGRLCCFWRCLVLCARQAAPTRRIVSIDPRKRDLCNMPLPPAPKKRAALLTLEAYDAPARSTAKARKTGSKPDTREHEDHPKARDLREMPADTQGSLAHPQSNPAVEDRDASLLEHSAVMPASSIEQ